ncbi:MAG: DUF1016 family protein [Colwellia sp.]|nr:DUF1016 family protein [Colwellia sp.]
MKGFSARNLKYMRKFAEIWFEKSIVQAVLAQISWYHNIALLEKLENNEQRLFYAKSAFENGWSRNILAIQIETKFHLRVGKSANNFSVTLPETDSDMANELKAGKFKAGHVSQLNMYMNIVDDTLRHKDDKPTIGLLLVREKNQTVAKYALSGYNKPIGVAKWEQLITDSLPEDLQPSLPSIEEIEKELEGGDHEA